MKIRWVIHMERMIGMFQPTEYRGDKTQWLKGIRQHKLDQPNCKACAAWKAASAKKKRTISPRKKHKAAVERLRAQVRKERLVTMLQEGYKPVVWQSSVRPSGMSAKQYQGKTKAAASKIENTLISKIDRKRG